MYNDVQLYSYVQLLYYVQNQVDTCTKSTLNTKQEQSLIQDGTMFPVVIIYDEAAGIVHVFDKCSVPGVLGKPCTCTQVIPEATFSVCLSRCVCESVLDISQLYNGTNIEAKSLQLGQR